ncbi:MAG: dual specificity protein phosphatase family protein [Candidatus Sericytochromatia bacterium]|nr:dual specificity protein phosphatase family protein [Candidatus Sericytochromatia bacterium]
MPRLHHILALTFAVGVLGCGRPPGPGLGAASASSARDVTVMSANRQAELARLDSEELTDQPLGEVLGDSLWPAPPPDDLGNVGEVDAHLLRGARPTAQGVRLLKERGVTHVISLENSKKVVAAEKAMVEGAGMRFTSLSMGLFIPPSESKVDRFLGLVRHADGGKIYFHCMQGRDRTGTMALAYRVRMQGWSFDKAYDEMKRFGFHTYLLGLNGFVRWYGNKYDHSGLDGAPARAR